MSRVKEGTTLYGYACDCKGCARPAVFTPLVCVPYERIVIRADQRAFVGMVDSQVCPEHFKDLRASDYLGPKMREAARELASKSGNKPDFEHVTLKPWRVHSSEYIDFQRAGGFVPADDAKAPGEIVMPN